MDAITQTQIHMTLLTQRGLDGEIITAIDIDDVSGAPGDGADTAIVMTNIEALAALMGVDADVISHSIMDLVMEQSKISSDEDPVPVARFALDRVSDTQWAVGEYFECSCGQTIDSGQIVHLG